MSLHDDWKSFEEAVLPAEAGENQRKQMEAAFYGGAWSVLTIIHQISGSNYSEEKAIAVVANLVRECEQFSKEYS